MNRVATPRRSESSLPRSMAPVWRCGSSPTTASKCMLAMPETFCTDHWRCRFAAADDTIAFGRIFDLLNRVNSAALK